MAPVNAIVFLSEDAADIDSGSASFVRIHNGRLTKRPPPAPIDGVFYIATVFLAFYAMRAFMPIFSITVVSVVLRTAQFRYVSHICMRTCMSCKQRALLTELYRTTFWHNLLFLEWSYLVIGTVGEDIKLRYRPLPHAMLFPIQQVR